MSALKTPQKTSKRQELREERLVTLYAKAWMFYEENRTLVYGILAGIVVLAAAIAGYVVYQNQQQQEAQDLLAGIVSMYEQGNYQQALDGTADAPGLLEIADEYGGTSAGNLAMFYAADALYRLGEYDRALQYFQQFDKTEDFIGASALAAQATIYENRGEFGQAAELYIEAANQFESSLTSPRYLLDAGRAYEAAGDYQAARETYETIREDYPDSEEAQGISKFIARARARQNEQS